VIQAVIANVMSHRSANEKAKGMDDVVAKPIEAHALLTRLTWRTPRRPGRRRR